MPSIDSAVSPVFLTCASLAVVSSMGSMAKITNPDFNPELQEGEFVVILNFYKNQSAEIDRLTSGMSDDDACCYMRDETNKALVATAESGSFHITIQKGIFGQVIPSIAIDRVIVWLEPTGRRRFVGIGKGSVASL